MEIIAETYMSAETGGKRFRKSCDVWECVENVRKVYCLGPFWMLLACIYDKSLVSINKNRRKKKKLT